MVILAGPGVLISTFCLGAALKLSFPYDWNWKTSLLLGGLLSATDPVAVVALLKELGASKKLSTIIEGESLMNDGTAIVVYQLFYQMVLGRSFNWALSLKYLVQVSFGAVGFGIAFGVASVLWLGFIFNDTVIEITLTLAVSYVAYFTQDKEKFEDQLHDMAVMLERLEGWRQKLLLEVTSLASLFLAGKISCLINVDHKPFFTSIPFFFLNAILFYSPFLLLDYVFCRLIHNLQR
ncbi:sodium/hydrogen exchanger 8 isoform X2 [Spinacia oleracea]|nr:sodium/hydrogen exchanger 8-like isoform X2 [Spinacia oleracea]XP_056682856.1 sodium/hydrogen exchanger 8-like isoform X2 [Spinacia oleracea]